MTDSVKFVEETDDAWIYEGLAIPYGGVTKDGQDLTGSHFTAKTDLCLDWFPDGGRPFLYRHGFDDSVKMSPVGRETGAVREDDKGRWYRFQIEKAKEYAAEVKQLLDDGVLALSSGAVDHLTKISAKSGEIKVWPWVELSGVPNPANPEALLYRVKSVDAVEHLTIVETAVPDAIAPEPTAKAIQTFSDIIAAEEVGEQLPEALNTLTSAVYSALWACDADFNPLPAEDKRAALQASLDQFRDYVVGLFDKVDTTREAPKAIRALDTNGLRAIYDAIGSVLSSDATPAEKDVPAAPRLVITGTAAVKEPDLDELTRTMTARATAKARDLLRVL
jgi:hypothetical protein